MLKRMNRHLFPVVDRTIQYKFLAITIIFSATIIILLIIPMFVPDFIAMGDEELSPELRGAAATRILTIHARVWPPAILIICVLSLYSLRIINRLIGPLFRFRWAFSKIGKGELNFRIKLRSRDYLSREADMFNEMMEMFIDQLGNMQSIVQDAVKSLDALDKFVVEKFGEQEEIQGLLQKHAQHLENLNQQAGYFQLGAEEKPEQETSGKAR